MITCKNCGTQNEKEFEYCKNCGAKLEEEQINQNGNSFNQDSSFNPNFTYNEPFYEGVTPSEMTLFVGKKSCDILPKFQKMKLSHSKVSWCWPLAVLSFLFGPFGAAIWFFYRKIYKYAWLFSGIGLLFSAITMIINFDQLNYLFDNLINAFKTGDISNLVEISEKNVINISTTSQILSYIDDLVNIALTVVTGIFGYYIYMNHAIEQIKSYKNENNDPRFYQMGISSIGGISGGMLAVGILVMIGSDMVISIIASLFTILV